VLQIWHQADVGIGFAEKAVAADPKCARYHYRLASAMGDVAISANLFQKIAMAHRIKKEIDLAVSLDPNNPEALYFLMQYYMHAPGIVGGDKAKARAVQAQIARIDPVRGAFAEIDLARLDNKDAPIEEPLRRAVASRPASVGARTALAGYLLSNKKFDEAETQAREAIRLNPDRVVAYAVLASALVRQNKWESLDPLLAQAAKAVPDDAYPYHAAAKACLDTGTELIRAERYLRLYLSQEPEQWRPTASDAHRQLGYVLEKQGRKSEAIVELQAALKLDPNSPAKKDLERLR
jgi:tetratricopeptide (TPR) repeat protein